LYDKEVTYVTGGEGIGYHREDQQEACVRRIAQGEAENYASRSQLQGEYIPLQTRPLQYFCPESGKFRKKHLPVNSTIMLVHLADPQLSEQV
jgi:hypothetical protein